MNLALFFTRDISLNTWVETGLFFREKLIYEEHLLKGNFKKVYWVTYGINDHLIASKLKSEGKLSENIYILQKPSYLYGKIGSLIYSFIVIFLYKDKLEKCSIFKSNQMDGAWSALIVSLFCEGKFYLRTGYTLSIFLKKQGSGRIKSVLVNYIERILYRSADIASVSSQYDKKYITLKYKPFCNVEIMYNYIDQSKFKDFGRKRVNKLVYVGRFNKQKNLEELLESCRMGKIELDLYGDGEEFNYLKKLYKDENIKFFGKVNNDLLPEILNNYKYYILVSHFEGMPKTLIEAMACGCYCIGTNVLGINELIDERRGYLVKGKSSKSILDGIRYAINDENYLKKTESSLNYINKYFSLDGLINKEFQLLNKE